MKALITGANRGIGFEFCRQLAERGDEVIAICRKASPVLAELVARSDLNVRIVDGVDVTDENGVAGLVEAVKGDEIDLLINNAGIMEGVTLDRLDIASIQRQFAVNAVAPLQITRALLDQLSSQAKVAIVTSRMGSIDDNDSGGSYGYRMSKVAANMAGRSLSIDLKSRGVSVALLHPGWVRTDMTGGNGLIDEVVVSLLDRINEHISWIKESSYVERVVVVLDEPALAVLGPDRPPLPKAARRSFETLLAEIDAEVGVHCCGDTDRGGLAELGFDWLSWDMSALAEGFLAGVDQLARAFGAGTRPIWGIVPATAGPLPETNVLVGRYGTAVANLVVAGAPIETLKAQAWFSPACGLAGLSVNDAEAVVDRLTEVVGEVESGW